MTCTRGCCESQKDHYRSVGVAMGLGVARRVQVELDSYKKARDEGSQPRGTKLKDSIEAFRESDRLGRAFRADDLSNTYYPEHTKALREWTGEEKKAIHSGLG